MDNYTVEVKKRKFIFHVCKTCYSLKNIYKNISVYSLF